MTATSSTRERLWLGAERLLFAVWAFAALITMAPRIGHTLHLSGTLFTSYAADLTNPAWVYIVFRRRPASGVARWVGRTPLLAAVSIFAVGVASELAQRYFPHLVTGTYDPFDILAFGTGLALCYAADKLDKATAA